MKKLAVICMFLMLTFTGCSTEPITISDSVIAYNSEYADISNPDDKALHTLEYIDNIPDGWKDSKCNGFFYDINTHVIYISTPNRAVVYKLESAEYRCYIYDTETGEFIGVK